MNFDYTYIVLFGRTIFEPIAIVTNLILFFAAIYCFRHLINYKTPYARQMAWFIFLLGVSSCFGALAHAVHYQLGKDFFGVVFFISNFLNLVSIYFCFRGSYTYFNMNRKGQDNKMVLAFVTAWLFVLMVFELIHDGFLLIKIHAGIVLIYALVVHYLASRHADRGSKRVVAGIAISFLSIIVHSLKLSFGEWFNYKDIAHVIMILSLMIIYSGIKINADKLVAQPVEA